MANGRQLDQQHERMVVRMAARRLVCWRVSAWQRWQHHTSDAALLAAKLAFHAQVAQRLKGRCEWRCKAAAMAEWAEHMVTARRKMESERTQASAEYTVAQHMKLSQERGVARLIYRRGVKGQVRAICRWRLACNAASFESAQVYFLCPLRAFSV